MPRYIDADALKRKAQKTATEAWKMKLIAKVETTLNQFIDWIDEMPTVQPEIIRCNACRHWHQTTGAIEGFGLGDCDYLEKKLVTCNGYCYWAERRTDE